MNFSIFLFVIGILGFVLNRKNIILMLISIEIMLLSATFLILISSLSFDDILGQTFAVYILTIAGAESAIGLGILVAYYRFYSSMITHCRYYSKNIFNKYFYSTSQRKNNLNYYNLKINKRLTNNFCLFNKPNNINFGTIGLRKYSSFNLSSLNPWFITGLLYGEGSFVITILNNQRYKTGWTIQAKMQIKMHERDRSLILAIQDFFGGIGYVSKPNNSSTVEFRISTLKDIANVIIPHFNEFPLKTKKYSDYLLFKQVILLMLNKEHKTLEGLQQIVNIRASLNLGLSDELKEAFPLTAPVKKSEVDNNYSSLSPEWIAGFSAGESNFFISYQKSNNNSGVSVWLRFSIGQHSKDSQLLEGLVSFFGCGYITKYKQRPISEFIVTRIEDITNIIIPFFAMHPIAGSKYSNYLDFKSASDIIKNKEHLNIDGKGLEKVLQLKNRISNTVNNNSESDLGVEEIRS